MGKNVAHNFPFVCGNVFLHGIVSMPIQCVMFKTSEKKRESTPKASMRQQHSSISPYPHVETRASIKPKIPGQDLLHKLVTE